MKMMFVCGRLLAAVALLCLSVLPASAQDDDEGPQKWGDDAKYVSVVFVQFKSGKREEAMDMIDEYFVPAGKKAGTAPPMLDLHFQTGKWDAMFIWNLDGGTADLEWYTSPDNVKWMAALAELNGGEEAAKEILARWSSLIDEGEAHVGHYHTEE